MARNRGFELVEPGILRGRDQHDRRGKFGRANEQPQRAFDIGAGAARRFAEIRFVDGDDVRQFHHARLHELQGIARARLHAQQESVGHERDVGFRLADADGFDQHAIVDGAHQHHGADGLVGQAAEPVPRRHRAHIDAAIAGIGGDPRAVGQQRAAGAARGRIDRDHADRLAALAKTRDQRVGEGGFAHAR